MVISNKSVHNQPALRKQYRQENDWTPEENFMLRRTFDWLGRGEINDVAKRLSSALPPYSQRTAITTGDGVGMGTIPTDAAAFIIELTAMYGAHKTLNVRPATSGRTTFPIVTALPSAVGDCPFVKPASQGTKLSPVATILGSGVATESLDLPVLIEVAIALLEDERADLSYTLPTLMAQAFAQRIDFAAFVADGTDDVQDGGQTGIFAHANVASVVAAATHTQVDTLSEEDLLRTVDAVADAALQRGCRWWVAPALYKKLLRLRDGSGARLVQFVDGKPFLVGSPVELVSVAPAVNAAGNKVMAFGCGDAYLVALRAEISLAVSDTPKFDYNVRQFRAISRVRCQMMDPTWFATLKLAAA